MTTTETKEQSIPNTEPEENGSENLPVAADVPKEDSAIYQVLDGLDDDLIKAELENRITKVWVYSFMQQGKEITGLSKVGVDAACTEMAKSGHIIEEGLVEYAIDPTNDEYFLFKVTASRILVNLGTGLRVAMETVNGVKRQWMKYKPKSSNTPKVDPFWFEKGAMKAVRNARSRLIPEEVKVSIIALAKEGGKIHTVTEEEVERGSPAKYAKDSNKRLVEAWVKQHLDGNRDAFKRWAQSLNMIGLNEDGEPTMNKVNMRLVDRLKAAPDDAASNFSAWYDQNKITPDEAAEILDGEVIEDGSTDAE